MPRRQTLTIALLILGAIAAIQFRRSYTNAYSPAAIAQALLLPIVLLVSFVNPFRDAAARMIDRLADPSKRARVIFPILIGLIGAGYFYLTATLHARDLTPRMQDEFSYVIQAHLLSIGRLWLPSPPLADFFETFHVLVKPVYASSYFPGTAMLYVPGVWVRLPYYVTSLMLCGLAISLTYCLARQLLNGACAILAALMLTCTTVFSFNSTLALSNVPAMIFGSLCILAWLQTRSAACTRDRVIAWACFGIAAGWGLIVRPLDLLAYLIPISLSLLIENRRTIFRWLPVAIAAAAPFLALQLVFNRGVTGEWLKTPYRLYFDEFQPNTKLGFVRDDPSIQPHTSLQQKIDLYDHLLRPSIREQTPSTILKPFLRWRLWFVVSATMPAFLLLVFLPSGIAAVFARARADAVPIIVCVFVPIAFVLLYTLYPYFMPYYPLAIAPPMVLLILFGARWTIQAFGDVAATRVLVFASIAALCIAALPEFRLDFGYENDGIPGLRGFNERIDAGIAPPAVILFKYAPGADFNFEPVYNYRVANPLDSPVLRAHDLGPLRNREIISYFAQKNPQTMFYEVIRGDRSVQVTPLGTAAQLQAQSAAPTKKE